MPESPPRLDGDTVLHATDGVLRRSAGDETVLLDLESEEFYGLDGVGARVFELLAEPRSVRALIDTLHTEYAVERDVLSTDLLSLVTELVQRRLVVVATER